MNTKEIAADKETLEGLVDRYGYAALLNFVAEIGSEKAEHIMCNWQDKNLARRWEKAASRLTNCVATIAKQEAL